METQKREEMKDYGFVKWFCAFSVFVAFSFLFVLSLWICALRTPSLAPFVYKHHSSEYHFSD